MEKIIQKISEFLIIISILTSCGFSSAYSEKYPKSNVNIPEVIYCKKEKTEKAYLTCLRNQTVLLKDRINSSYSWFLTYYAKKIKPLNQYNVDEYLGYLKSAYKYREKYLESFCSGISYNISGSSLDVEIAAGRIYILSLLRSYAYELDTNYLPVKHKILKYSTLQ